jgi:hypothetical protein
VEVLGEHVRGVLLQQLHANDVPIETAEMEAQTEVIEFADGSEGAVKEKSSKPAKKRKPLYPGAGSAKAMAYDSGASFVGRLCIRVWCLQTSSVQDVRVFIEYLPLIPYYCELCLLRLAVIRLVHEAYEVKIIADAKDVAAGRPRQPFSDFVKDFLIRKYGLKTIAMKHLGEIYASVEKNKEEIPHMKVFGLISGMVNFLMSSLLGTL